MKRIIALLIAVLMCTALFVACADDTPSADGGDTTVADTTTAPAETTAPPTSVNIASNGATEYLVIRPDGAGKEVVNAASDLRVALSDAVGVQFRISDDWVKDPSTIPATAKEIVVGACNRPECENIAKTLRRRDFAVVYSGERIYIMGGSDEATARGTEYFIANYIDKAGKAVSVMDNLNYMESYAYPLGAVSINGVNLMQYKIVIPEKADLLTESAAKNLSDYLLYEGGYIMETVSDSEATTDYEILIGDTNRSESDGAVAVSLAEDQYVLAQTGSKIVMYGKGYMVGGAVSDFINNYACSATAGQSVDITNIPTTCSASTFKFEKPESAILLIGDGMGFNHVEMTKDSGTMDEFVAEQLPNLGKASTVSYSVQTGKKDWTDSAAAATALATGYKTYNGYVGMNHKGATVKNVRELAQSVGARTAIMTTDTITGATPAGFLAHVKDRDLTDQIQAQIDKLLDDGKLNYAVSHKDSDEIIEAIREPLWGIAAGGSRYFSMIEAAYIDKEAHYLRESEVMKSVRRYNEIIAYCIEYTLCHPNSVLIITADHETGGLIKNSDGTYKFTNYTKTNYVNHTSTEVPVYALGMGTEMFNGVTVDNTDIPEFIAKAFGAATFGQ